MKEVYEFLKKCSVYYLATVEGDQPRVRPFGTVNIFEDKLYIQTGKIKPVAHQMKANYQPGDGNTEVYYLKNATAQICGFGAPVRTINF